jgi:phage protein D/phage baseplate assembly protein gpV
MTSPKVYGARPIISVGGSPLPEQVQSRVRQVVVDTDAGGPDSCRIVLDDPKRDVLPASGIDLHVELRVTAGRTGEQTGEPVFDGLVYHLGFEYHDRGAFTTVVAYDRSYGLYNGLHTATYLNVTDSDLVTRLGREVGLTAGTIEATSVVHEHVSQVNETHWDFLSRRAREIDYTLRVTGSRLDFVRSTEAGEGPDPGDFESVERLALVPGGNLEQLSARVTAAQQVSEVEVRGWDPKTKRAVVATAPARTRAAKLADDPAAVAGRFGSPRHVTVDLPLTTQAECDAVAQAQAERLAGSCVYAEGVARGDPRLVAGAAVSLGQTGGRFDGKLTVSRARHTWDGSGYRTSFSVSGVHDRSLLGLVDNPRPKRTDGVVVGVVTNVSDPDGRGRVKLRLPWLSDEYESDWARVVQLGAGDKRGLLLLPEVNDEVLVAFEQGDTRRPYVVGGLYNGVDAPPFDKAVDTAAGKVQERGIRTRKGHELRFVDTDGAERIELKTKDNTVTVILDAATKELRIEAGGNVTVHTGKDFTVTADGKGTISAKAGLTLKSDGEVTVRGATIKLN